MGSGAGAGEAGGAGEANISLSPLSPGNNKGQLSIMFPTQASGLSILDKFIQPQSLGCMETKHQKIP
ncbi:hypothetical protein NIES4072_39660 [Nostoc commune NIES-4072]|uniref:Uncharacterized protein n=1 Tax=Nostoc commune NIES-4072 TaxID=2005467 RepID=A0A2R5FQH1_NOSCO|nr:hypothetical protein NIES4070_51110 [Nostoc commune HK-02]GBG20289.1 hypothetical protein NIES4072_39660 [Nostoc commune NIES-4072]